MSEIVSFLSPELKRRIVVLFLAGARNLGESTGDLYVHMPGGSTPTLVRRDQFERDELYQQAKREASEYFSLLVEHEIDQMIALADQLWFSAHNVSSQWYREPGTE